MQKMLHLFHLPDGEFKLVEMCMGWPSRGAKVRGVLAHSRSLAVILRSIRQLGRILQWDGLAVSRIPPKRGVPAGCKPLTAEEDKQLAECVAEIDLQLQAALKTPPIPAAA